jgi:hypothetical protein
VAQFCHCPHTSFPVASNISCLRSKSSHSLYALQVIMASRLVNHISYKVKKLIVGHAGSKPTAAACNEKEADYGSGSKNRSAAGSKPTAAACDEKEANFESGSKKHSADAAEMHRSFQDAVTKDAGADASTVMVVINVFCC